MLNRLKGIFNFDQIIWSITSDGEYYTAEVYLKVDRGYSSCMVSRKKLKALGYALRDIADQLIKDGSW